MNKIIVIWTIIFTFAAILLFRPEVVISNSVEKSRTATYTRHCEQLLDGVYVFEEATLNHYCRTKSGYVLIGVAP